MVPSRGARKTGGTDSGTHSVFLATLLWVVTLCVIPWMIPASAMARLRGLPFQPRYAFWAMAVLTLLVAWPARRDASRGSMVLAGSLVLAALYWLTLR